MSDALDPQGSAQGASSAQDLQAEVEKLRADYAASSGEAKRLKQERDFFEAQTQRQPAPPSQDPFQRLRDEGWPVDQLLPVFEQIADRKAQQRFDPLIKGIEARGRVMASNPDFGKYEQDVMGFVGSNPELQQKYTGLMNAGFSEEAMELAFHKFSASQAKQPKPNGNGNAQAKADAQIPSGRSGDKRNNNNDDNADYMNRARAEYQKTGNPAARDAYAKARLRQAIPDSFFEK